MILKFYTPNLKLDGETYIPTNNFENHIKEHGSFIHEIFGNAEFIKIDGCDYETAHKIIFMLRENKYENKVALPPYIWEVVTGFAEWSKMTIWSNTMDQDETTKEWLVFNPYSIRGYSINYNIYDLI